MDVKKGVSMIDLIKVTIADTDETEYINTALIMRLMKSSKYPMKCTLICMNLHDYTSLEVRENIDDLAVRLGWKKTN